VHAKFSAVLLLEYVHCETQTAAIALRQRQYHLCGNWQALVTAMQHLHDVSREEAEQWFAAGVQYTDDELEVCRRKIEDM